MSSQLWGESTGTVNCWKSLESTCANTHSKVCFPLLVPVALSLWAKRVVSLYDTAQTYQMVSWKLEGRFYNTLGYDLHKIVLFPQNLFKVYRETSVWCRHTHQIWMGESIPWKNVLVLKRRRWKFNTYGLAKITFPCVQNWRCTPSSTSQVPGAI